jgi:multidrug efflux pump subunit AcrA (membrane-fusion protein)
MDSLRLREHSQSDQLSWRRTGLAALSALAGLLLPVAEPPPAELSPRALRAYVKVETAKLISVNDTTQYVATLKSRDTAVIMPQVEGVITDIYVHSGSRVSAGTPSCRLIPPRPSRPS